MRFKTAILKLALSVMLAIICQTAEAQHISVILQPDCFGNCNGRVKFVGEMCSNSPSNYVYQWSNGDTGIVADSLCAWQTICVTVTDTICGGCETFCLTMSQSGPWGVPTSTPEICGNGEGTATMEVTDGVSPIKYIWSNGATTETITGLSSGDYYVTATDANGCATTGWVYVYNEVAQINVSANVHNPTCGLPNGAIKNVKATGGTLPYTYKWSANTLLGLDSLPAGNYTVTATDANGCTGVKVFTLTNIGLPAVVSVDTSSCSPVLLPWGDTAFVSATYTWFDSTGCGTQYEWDVTISPTIEKVISDTICSGSTYNFGGTAYDQSGTFSFSDSTVNGCPRNWMLFLTVLDSVKNVIVHKPTCVAKDDEIFHLTNVFGCSYDSLVVYDVLPETWLTDTVQTCDPYAMPTLVTVISPEGCVTNTIIVPNYVGIADTTIWLVDCKSHPDSTVTEWVGFCFRTVIYKWNVQDLDMVYEQVFTCDDALAYTYADIIAYTNSNCPYTIRTWTFPKPIELVTLPDTLVCFNSTLVGPIIDTVLNVNGCRLMRVMNVQKLPQPMGHEVITLCVGETTVRNGVQISEPGVYTALSGVSTFGCDSSTVMQVVYISGQKFFTAKDTCNLGYDGKIETVYVQSPNSCQDTLVTNWHLVPNQASLVEWSCDGPTTDTTYIVIGSDSCITNMTCHRFRYAPVDSFETRQVCPTEFPFTWNGDTITGSGKYSAILENASIYGCDIRVNLTVYEQPLAVQTDSVSVCENEDFYYAEKDTFLSTGVHDFFFDCSVNRVVVSNYVDELNALVPGDVVLRDSTGMSLAQVEDWVQSLAGDAWYTSVHNGVWTSVQQNLYLNELTSEMADYTQVWTLKGPCGEKEFSRNIKVFFPPKPELPAKCRFRIYPNPSTIDQPITAEFEGFYGELKIKISSSNGTVESESVTQVNGFNQLLQLNLPQRRGVWFITIEDDSHDFTVRAIRK